MFLSVGLIAALIAFFSWGLGDFFMQRSIRGVGKIEALFYNTIFAAVVLFPFVRGEVLIYIGEKQAAFFLLAAAVITLVAALLEFAAMEKGKLAIIEPVMSLELPITIAIGLVLLSERLNWQQLGLILVISVAVVVVSVHRRHKRAWWEWWRKKQSLFETGVIIAGLGAVAMAATNIFTGLASRGSSPLTTIWFINLFLAVVSIIWLIVTGAIKNIGPRLFEHWPVVLAMSVFDNAAWLAYSYAVLALPISLAIGITESYVALAAFLGWKFNQERLQTYQIIGGVVAIVGSVMLAIISG